MILRAASKAARSLFLSWCWSNPPTLPKGGLITPGRIQLKTPPRWLGWLLSAATNLWGVVRYARLRIP